MLDEFTERTSCQRIYRLSIPSNTSVLQSYSILFHGICFFFSPP